MVASTAARRLLQQAKATSKGPAFAFDIDGVLRAGKRVLPEAKEALAIVSGKNRWGRAFPFILCTNGGGVLEADRAKQLSQEFGVDIGPNRLMLSHTPMRRYATDFANSPVMVIGGKGDACRKVAQSYGFKHVFTPHDLMRWQPDIWPFERAPEQSSEELPDFAKLSFAAIFVFHDTLSWGRDAQVIVDIARGANGVMSKPRDRRKAEQWESDQQIPVHWSNPDLIFKGGFDLPRFGQGAFQEAVKSVYLKVTGHKLHSTTHGKPTASTYTHATEMLQRLAGKQPLNPSQIYMVGDNPESDIAGGNQAKWNTALVRTGVYNESDGPPTHSPTYLCDNVLDAVNIALEREGVQ